MFKQILTGTALAIALTFASALQAQAKCAPDTNMQAYTDVLSALDTYRPGLRTARDVVRKNAKNTSATKRQIRTYERIELITLRLEYWSKDTARYMRKYMKSHPDAICARLAKDHNYLNDFMMLALLYKQSPSVTFPQLHDGLYK